MKRPVETKERSSSTWELERTLISALSKVEESPMPPEDSISLRRSIEDAISAARTKGLQEEESIARRACRKAKRERDARAASVSDDKILQWLNSEDEKASLRQQTGEAHVRSKKTVAVVCAGLLILSAVVAGCTI